MIVGRTAFSFSLTVHIHIFKGYYYFLNKSAESLINTDYIISMFIIQIKILFFYFLLSN